MREITYYLNEKLNGHTRPALTVVVIVNEEEQTYARGIAICSHREIPCRRTGRQIARGRAIQSLVREKAVGDIRRNDAFDVLFGLGRPGEAVASSNGLFKGAFMPILTQREIDALYWDLDKKDLLPDYIRRQ